MVTEYPDIAPLFMVKLTCPVAGAAGQFKPAAASRVARRMAHCMPLSAANSALELRMDKLEVRCCTELMVTMKTPSAATTTIRKIAVMREKPECLETEIMGH